MVASIKHKFVSTVPDGGDTDLVRPSNWNDEHDVSGLEPALGDPASDDYVLSSKADGTRSWVAAPSTAPGGSDTQVQYNDGGAFGGDSGFTFNETNKTVNLGGGTVTADDPVLDLTQTWNNAAVTFNGIKLNVTATASATASSLLDLQVGGTTKFKVNKAGVVYFSALAVAEDLQFRLRQAAAFCWAATSAGDAADTFIVRDSAANVVALRNSTSAQTFRLYNTYTDASNHERGKLSWSSNIFNVGTEKAGTGTARAMALQTDGTTRATVGAAGGIAMAAGNTFQTGAYTVATLPTPQVLGRLAHVTDGDASLAWGATVVNSGSGATKYLVFDNGAAWTVAGK